MTADTDWGPPEQMAARAGFLAREGRVLADVRLLRALRRVRAAIKADRRPCPDNPRRRAFGEIMWSPSARWHERFYGELRRRRPARLLELGTSVGLTGLYVLAAVTRNRHGHFFTVEAAPSKADYARRLFEAFGNERATCLGGRSEAVLPALLAREPVFDWVFVDIDHSYRSTVDHLQLLAPHIRPGGLILFDDINLSDEMRRAWGELRRHPRFAWSTLDGHRRAGGAPRIGVGERL